MATATDNAPAATTAIARPRRCRYGTTTTSSETHSAVVPVVCPDGKLNPSAVVSQGTRSGRGRQNVFEGGLPAQGDDSDDHEVGGVPAVTAQEEHDGHHCCEHGDRH